MRVLFEWDADKAKDSRPAMADDDMPAEFDFRNKTGVRGKYYRAYRRVHTVRIYNADGTVNVQHFTLADGAIMLEPDVSAYFPYSDAVNTALRSLIASTPARSPKRKIILKSPSVRARS